MKRQQRTSRRSAVENLDLLESRQLLSNLPGPPSAAMSFYSVDGTGNNAGNPSLGSDNSDLLRIAPAQYGDGISTPAGADRPSARAISNVLDAQGNQQTLSSGNLSAMAYAWGQFIDHDLDLSVDGASSQSFNIAVPKGDPSFDPNSTGTKTIPLTRSAYDPSTGTTTPRQQVNTITAWIDGSMIYGSNSTTAAALRTMQGGKLKTGQGNLLPTDNAATFPTGTVPMNNDAGLVPNSDLFAAGDVRANENIELTSLQTLFVREHNYWADQFAKANPSATDEQLYQEARSVVIAEIQSITYNQWLPAILGPNAIGPYQGYDPKVNPDITNEFSTAAFRFGHSMLGNDVEFLGNNGISVAPSIPLSQAFSNPDQVRTTGIDPILKYLSSDPSSEIDTKVVDSLRNLLFGPPGSGGLDLASLNIQRGRDHGLADYNTTRASLGLPKVTEFSQITSDPTVQAELKEVYGSVDKIDLWVGGLAEDHVPGGNVGPTFEKIIANQFQNIRSGDRLWFENQFSGPMLQRLEHTSLSDIIQRNTDLTTIQHDPFHYHVAIAGGVYAPARPAGPGGGQSMPPGGGQGQDQGRGQAPGGMTPPHGPGIAGQTVNLVDMTSNTVVASRKTDARGQYHFDVADGLSLGQFEIQLVAPTSSTSVVASSPMIPLTRGDQMVNHVDLIAPPPTGTPHPAGQELTAGDTTPPGDGNNTPPAPRGSGDTATTPPNPSSSTSTSQTADAGSTQIPTPASPALTTVGTSTPRGPRHFAMRHSHHATHHPRHLINGMPSTATTATPMLSSIVGKTPQPRKS